jgi:hypothetical protein
VGLVCFMVLYDGGTVDIVLIVDVGTELEVDVVVDCEDADASSFVLSILSLKLTSMVSVLLR